MLTNIKNKFKKQDNKVLLSNFLSLSTLQIANFVLPLLTIPYLIRVLGVELYGLLAFATALIMYFLILSDYGFNLTATREISVHRDDKEKVVEIFSSVMSIKIILMFMGLLILALIVSLFDKFASHALIYYLTFGMVLGQVLFPTWFFQGMEKMKYISVLNIVAKLLFVICIFIFVKTEEDVFLVPLFNSLGFIVAGVISLFYIKKEFGISFAFQKKETMLYYLKDGWHIFLSRIAVVLYSSSNVFILGLFTNNTIVAYYAIADKVIMAISSLGRIVNQVLFPHLSKLWNVDRALYYAKFRKLSRSIVVVMSVIAIGLYFLSPYIIYLLTNEYLLPSIELLQLMLIVIVLYPLGGLFSQSFVTQQQNYLVTRVTVITMIVNLVLVFPLIKYYDAYGLVWTIIIVQVLHLLINTVYYIKLKKRPHV